MMRKLSTLSDYRLWAILLATTLLFGAGCASKNAPAPDSGTMTDSEFSDGASDSAPVDPNAGRSRLSASDVRLPPIYFDLDSTRIRDEFAAGLEGGARALKESGATVVIEGHCDERGSEEYNMALGERRAGAIRKYLYNLGVPMGQMTVVSYGEVQPAVSGRGESAWRLNRRGEFKVR